MDADVSSTAGPPADPDQPEEPAGNGPADGSRDGSADSTRDGPAEGGRPDGSAATGQEGAPPAPDGTEAGPEPDGPDGRVESGAADGPDDGAASASGGSDDAGFATWEARPEGGPRKRRWLRRTALGASFVVLVAAGAGWWVYRKLDGNITTDTSAAAELRAYERERPTPVAHGDAQNILLIGSDSRSGENSEYGRDDGGSQRSDTTILLHLAADRGSATAVSLPRDLMSGIPRCHDADGKATEERFAQFNWAFEVGGTACTVRTVEKMTGVRVDHHMVIDFNGFKDMVDAVDGVEVCLKEPVDDKDARLSLPAGRQKLDGEEALGYVRARKSIGDGSDTERMDRQQKFLGALVNKMQSNGVLLNPARLYPVLDAATKSLTTDPGLDSLRDLYDLVRSMRNVPTEQVQFLTVPRRPYRANPNRDELVQPDADQLFEKLRKDESVTVLPSDEINGEDSQEVDSSAGDRTGEKPGDTAGSPTPAPTYSGSSAADDPCDP
ncbi:LytR family transcriptional regulator [Streptomyces nitrosporeus]|uniref:LytR family transcriptional regulator n=1 Tax=Streptomyces nitrosporeus TaxID=28894 RepID=A0A5J6FGZ1_9ACTN|nr:LCP family protein [Streptomyces nitrosporeus]QEU74150.1 LytR family transcriptional regulator [Streptomyces nitrosporeus]GGZ26428.1 transcriptional regulator [Streptomyces nitrosporeus]